MLQYSTGYSDRSGRTDTKIINSFKENGTNCLTLRIDGVVFNGSSFDDFELINQSTYNENQLNRFTFNKVQINQSGEFVWVLCNCRIEVNIPQKFYDSETEMEINSNLHIDLHLGRPLKKGGISKLKANFKVQIGKEQFTSESDNFESAFLQLQKELLPHFHFRNCFSCHYSDYSPYGNGFFGSLMCFRENKLNYLSATVKEDFLKLAGQGFITVQETYVCDQFLPREKDTGYRGWPFEDKLNEI